MPTYTKEELLAKLANGRKKRTTYIPVVRTLARVAAASKVLNFLHLQRIPLALDHGTFWKNIGDITTKTVQPMTDPTNWGRAALILIPAETAGRYMDKGNRNLRVAADGFGIKLW